VVKKGREQKSLRTKEKKEPEQTDTKRRSKLMLTFSLLFSEKSINQSKKSSLTFEDLHVV
jgi:hypothetical protein